MCTLVLTGNLISLITLASMTKRGLFIKLLLTLTTFDTLFLINGGVFMLQQAFSFQNEVYNALFPKVIFPLAGISMTGTYVQDVRLKGLQRGLLVLITFNSLGIGRKSTREMKCLLFFRVFNIHNL